MKTLRLTLILAVCLFLQAGLRAQDNNARYISQSTPGEMEAGKTYGLSVTMKNTGRTVWYKGSHALKLINVPDDKANIWGVNKIDINSSVSPGEEVVFNFSVTAPDAGGYNLQWQMVNGNAYFGEPTISAPVTVTGSTTANLKGTNSAMFTAQKVPTDMDVEHIYPVSYTVKNDGTSTWKQGEYKLKVNITPAEITNNSTWLIPNVDLPYDVVPGSEVTFTFNVTAWVNDGNFTYQAQMIQNEVPFGQMSTPVLVNVH